MILNLDKRLRALRIENNLRVDELASILNIDSNIIYGIENGTMLPDIDLLPDLCTNLGCSIDYLLTGKNVINSSTLTRLEAAVRDENIPLILTISNILEYSDEANKTIFSYILKYDSIKVFDYLINKYSLKSIINNKSIDKSLIYSILIKENYLKELEGLKFFSNTKDDPLAMILNSNLSIYDDGVIDYFIKYVKHPSAMFDRLISLHLNDLINPINKWQDIYSNLIELAIKYDRLAMANEIADLIIKINKASISEYDSCTRGSTIYSSRHSLINNVNSKYDRDSINYALVAVSKKSIEGLLNNNELARANELYKTNKRFNLNLVRTGLFRSAELRINGETDKNMLYVIACTDNGLIDIDRLLKSNNYYLIKNALNSYPIAKSELKEKNEAINEINIDYLNKGYTPNEVRANLLNELFPKLVNKNKDLMTKEYFKSLLFDNNIDMLVIKMSVKLESILKNKYKLEGTFEEMIDEYIEKFNIKDEIKELLHKLRKQRNSAVHADRTGQKLVKEELDRLIKIIFKME